MGWQGKFESGLATEQDSPGEPAKPFSGNNHVFPRAAPT
jgi:hypothetical protein